MPHFEGTPQKENAPSDADVVAAFESGENLDQALSVFRKWEIAEIERAEKAGTVAEMLSIEIKIAALYGKVGLVRAARERLERIIADVTNNEALEDAADGGETGLHEVHVDALHALQALPSAH